MADLPTNVKPLSLQEGYPDYTREAGAVQKRDTDRASTAAGLVGPDADRAEWLEWPRRFQQKYRRPPRILHLGNVANYAYVNAKLMRAHGIEAEVFDPDFFHIMATPEWIEAHVEGDHGDDFRPDWTAVNLNGYKAPQWFLQTPMTMGLSYLAMNRSSWDARSLRKVIDAHRRTVGVGDGFVGGVHAAGVSQNVFMRGMKRAVRESMSFWSKLKGERFDLPELPDPHTEEDAGPSIIGVNMLRESFQRAFARYDIVQGYTISAAYPLAAGVKNTVAYELGTLRGLPFEDSPMGKLCAWTYRNAAATFVTNVDCVSSAHKLGIAPEKINAMLHAFDLDGAVAHARNPAAPRHSAEVPFFFAPARHHWKMGNASWLKGNDVYIRAAGQLARRGYEFRFVMIEWGEELGLSRALIEQEGITDRVDWLRPLCRTRLWPYYLGAAAVVDQFKAPAFGGVALETLALGRPLISAFDREASRQFFGSAPSMFNVSTVEDVADAMAKVLDDPAGAQEIGLGGQRWMQNEHSVERQLSDQYRVYDSLVARNGISAQQR
ncbi:glycosyltransferase [Aliihoeflea aestuarii]|uniref:glycosyltransferase n=1 Tax=Aliihoeflea aestuarii TaxID=453840 RepID=UPI002092D11D|nr:glycosyltransferase [Aliihoeflea aestuarii]MCO6390176.1 glycosyltransferase [Aliihoeflea aestuarii]